MVIGRSQRNRVTIRDVAAVAEVSISTVSAAFTFESPVALDTRRRVLAAANQLGWRPDRRASRLRRNRTALLGVVYEVEQSFQAALVDSIYQAASEGDLEVILAGATERHSELDCLRLLITERCDGLLLTGSTLAKTNIAYATSYMPILSLSRVVGIAGVDEVVSDSMQCQRLVVEHLRGLGHEEIWYLGARERSMGQQREEGYLRAIEENGLKPYVVEVGATLMDGIRMANALVNRVSMPTALMCYNDVLAVSIVRRLRQLGVDVPGEISIVGYDNAPIAADPTVWLTTVSQPHELMVQRAIELIAKRMDSGLTMVRDNSVKIVFSGELEIRGTTGRPRLSFQVRNVSEGPMSIQ